MRKKILLLVALVFLSAAFYSWGAWNKSTEPVAVNAEGNAKPKEISFQFAVLGDSKILPDRPQWQGNVVLSKLVQEINKDNPDLVVYLGDGPDQGGPISNMVSFREALSKLKSPWHPAVGNHEILRGAGPDGKEGDGEGNFLEVFGDKLPVKDSLGNRVGYYSFDYLGSHFIILDTAWQDRKESGKSGLYPGSAQWEWLTRDLETARPKSGHIFVFGHEPPLLPYKSGGKAGSNELSDIYGTTWNNPRAVESFVQLCRQYRVDAVFSGHLHAFLRFNDGDITHIITGGAGADLHVPPEVGGYYHYVRCSIEGDKASYEVVPLN